MVSGFEPDLFHKAYYMPFSCRWRFEIKLRIFGESAAESSGGQGGQLQAFATVARLFEKMQRIHCLLYGFGKCTRHCIARVIPESLQGCCGAFSTAACRISYADNGTKGLTYDIIRQKLLRRKHKERHPQFQGRASHRNRYR